MDGATSATLVAQDLGGAVGYNFVDVHVGGGAGASLEYIDDKVVFQVAVNDVLGSGDYGVADLFVERTKLHVDQSGDLFDLGEAAVEGVGEAEGTDGEVEDGALSGCAVVGVSGNLHLPHRVAFCACVVGMGHLVCLLS